jgi:hypothetical protein
VIDLSNNAIATTIASKSFPKTLRRLDLSFNEIKSVRELLYLTNLTDLNVSHNKLKHIDPLPASLVNLDISYNYIQDISEFDVLKANQALQWVCIESDQIPQGYLRVTARELKRCLPALDMLCLQDILNTKDDDGTCLLNTGPDGPGEGHKTPNNNNAISNLIHSYNNGQILTSNNNSSNLFVVANTAVVALNGRSTTETGSTNSSRSNSRSGTPNRTVFTRLHEADISAHRDILSSPERKSVAERERRMQHFKDKSAHYFDVTGGHSPTVDSLYSRKTASFQASIETREKHQQELEAAKQQELDERLRNSSFTSATTTSMPRHQVPEVVAEEHFLQATENSRTREALRKQLTEQEELQRRHEQSLQPSSASLFSRLSPMSGNMSVSSMSWSSQQTPLRGGGSFAVSHTGQSPGGHGYPMMTRTGSHGSLSTTSRHQYDRPRERFTERLVRDKDHRQQRSRSLSAERSSSTPRRALRGSHTHNRSFTDLIQQESKHKDIETSYGLQQEVAEEHRGAGLMEQSNPMTVSKKNAPSTALFGGKGQKVVTLEELLGPLV